MWARTRDMRGIDGYTRLKWGPVTRPGDAHTLLVVKGHGGRVIKLGPEQRLVFSKEELQEHLVSLVQSESFRASLKDLERLAAEPVEGFLRSGYPRDRDPSNDVFVEVAPDVQQRLAKVCLDTAQPTGVEDVRVRLAGPSPIGRGVFQDRKDKLKWLVSGGVVVKLAGMPRDDGGWVVLSGDVQREE